MPTILKEAGYRLHFFSADGHEPPHVHIEASGRKAKVWLRDLRVAKNSGFGEVEMGRIVQMVSDNRVRLLEAWNDFFA
jgi:hypothetical protein